DFLPVPATHAYTLKYRTTRQLGFFDDHDELYWNATGNDSIFVIDHASVDVRLPQPVPVAGLLAEAYTGPQGSRGQAYVATVPAPGTAHWDTTQPLPPGHGLTIVLSFPKGIVAEPDAAQRAQWFLRDNLGVLVGLAALALLLAFCIRRWRAIGRDPAPGVIIARYEAPAGHTPGGLRYIRKMGADQRAFSADLIELAVAGYLRIHREDGVLVDDWKLEQLRPPDDALLPSQRVILEQLFADGPMLELDNKQASTLQAARTLHAKAFGQRYQPAMFKLNGGSTGIATLIAVTGTVAAFVASGGAGIPLIIVLALAMLAVLIIFAILVRAHAPEGRRMLDEIEGLKLYLGVAEREELARLAGPGGDAPPLDADRYQRLLPYAVALEVEDAWTEQFTSVVGAEEAAAVAGNIAWYSGGR